MNHLYWISILLYNSSIFLLSPCLLPSLSGTLLNLLTDDYYFLSDSISTFGSFDNFYNNLLNDPNFYDWLWSIISSFWLYLWGSFLFWINKPIILHCSIPFILSDLMYYDFLFLIWEAELFNLGFWPTKSKYSYCYY